MKFIKKFFSSTQPLLSEEGKVFSKAKIKNQKEIDFYTKEKDRLQNFKEHHICPDRKPYHREPFETQVFYDGGSGIGANVIVKCVRCGC